MKCIIVDDEPLALLRLESQIIETGLKISVIGKCTSGKEAIKQINQLKPDLVFLDIQMPEVDGFQVIEQLEFMPLLVFTTAYDEFALKAFQAKGIRYLLKPIKLTELVESITFASNYLISSDLLSRAQNDTLIVKELGKEIFIPIKEIIMITTIYRIVFIFFSDQKIIADKGMDEYESLLPTELFFRTHRSYIININCIMSVVKSVGGKRLIQMKNGVEATLSRDHVKNFEQRINS